MESLRQLGLILVLSPLIGSVIAGIFGKRLGRTLSHRITIGFMFVAFFTALRIWQLVVFQHESFYGPIYVWVQSGSFQFDVGFMIDKLTAWMCLVVTFVSLLVHIYSIGYMATDPGYQRFFSYMSLFTFAMLMLVTANNFLQLFFGWEGVGLVSYLLIGFWFKKNSAVVGSLKAFLVNRVGDFGFLLGIAAVVTYFGSLDYQTVFTQAPTIYKTGLTMSVIPGLNWSVLSVICICLFIGAMGKSAQMPLHVWLPESMEGPTPISALIHAATMVTAGIFMVSRMSPLFELSPTALSLVLVIGATGALFTGLLGVVQDDIKRVIAYSTLSQLGYMTAALGASAFAAGIFHLMTHAMFKALLFLGAGSVIIAMHHEQSLSKMGGLRKYMPITYITFLIGGLSLSAIPPFAGFYSKDAIIEAVHLSTIPGSRYSYYCVLLGAFVTALYTFRAFFLAFHGEERIPKGLKNHVKESPWVVWVPLVLLSIPSAIAGAILAGPILYQTDGLLGKSIYVVPKYNVLTKMATEYQGWFPAAQHSVTTLTFWLAALGIFTAWLVTIRFPNSREYFVKRFSFIHQIFIKKYGFDDFNQIVLANGGHKVGKTFYRIGDVIFIDNFIVNGSAKMIGFFSGVLRRFQSGYLYQYAFVMIIALAIFLTWFMFLDLHVSLFSLFKTKAFNI